MRIAALLLATFASTPALAGGVGIIGHGGVHTERVYYYTNINEANEVVTDRRSFTQVQTSQLIPQFGGGLEFILGDRDDKIIGVFRGFYNQDAGQTNPKETVTSVNPENVFADVREGPRHVGMASMGLNWGVIGKTDGAIVGLSAHIGSGFLTTDRTEFFQAMIGPTLNVRVARSAQVFVDAQYLMRVRNELDHGVHGVAGLRMMFD